MFVGNVQKNPPSPLCVSSNVISIVKCFKLLGINISGGLRWDAHVDALCAKVASRLYFLKIPKRSGLSTYSVFFINVSYAQSLNTAAWYLTTANFTVTIQ